jgi:hypothetical protein
MPQISHDFRCLSTDATDASLIENLNTRDYQSLVLVLAPGHHGAVKK